MSSGRINGQSAIPERPLLPPWLRVARVGDRLLLEHGDAILSLEGKAATLLLPQLLPLLDGTRTLDDLAARLGSERAAAAEHAVAALAERGYVIEGPSCDDPTARLAVSIARDDVVLEEAAARLAGARLCLVGNGATADELERLLRPAGPRLERASWDDAPGEPDLVVAAPCSRELPKLSPWNERMLDLRVPWLQVLPFNGRAAFVGPLYLPDETACHACFSFRRGEALGEAGDFLALDAVPAAYPQVPALAATLAGLAATVVLRWLATKDPALPGAFHALELGDGFALTRHRVLRVPRCHACSGTHRLPPPLPWADEVLR